MKHLLLIAAMVPTAAAAHEWNQQQWLQRWLNNRVHIGKCLRLAGNDIVTYHKRCDAHTMGTIENKEFARYHTEKLMHPLDDDLTFVTEHFSHDTDDWIWGVYQNVVKTPVFNSAIIQMYIAEGLTKNNAAEDVPEGNTGAVNERPGNNAVHDK